MPAWRLAGFSGQDGTTQKAGLSFLRVSTGPVLTILITEFTWFLKTE